MISYCCCLLTKCGQLFWDPVDYSLPDASVHGIFQARILEWVAISFSRGSSQSRDQIHVSCIGRRILYHWLSAIITVFYEILRLNGLIHLVTGSLYCFYQSLPVFPILQPWQPLFHSIFMSSFFLRFCIWVILCSICCFLSFLKRNI